MREQPNVGLDLWWDELTQVRRQLVRVALRGQAPPHPVVAALESWIEELTRVSPGAVTVERLAHTWGNLQLLLIECGPENSTNTELAQDTGLAWQRLRRSVEQGFMTLLARPEWASLTADLRDEVLPLLADAVAHPREGRVIRCLEATAHLHALALRTSGMPHAWRLWHVAEMQYPRFAATGWHGRMGVDFTWRRARAVIRALLEAVRRQGLDTLPLVVGYDSRVHADLLAAQVAEIASACGHPVHLCSRDTPAPALVHYMTTLGISRTAGLINCTASRLPVKDGDTGLYAGVEYQGLRYYTPYGAAPAPEFTMQVSRHTAELLLEESPLPHNGQPGEVLMIEPLPEYTANLVAEMGYAAPAGEFDAQPAREALVRYWRHTGALIVLDEMHGATRGYLRAVCEELHLPYEVIHGGRNPLFGDLPAANPEPPHLGDLSARVRELSEERYPLIGLACDADGDRFGVVDETGAYLPGNAVLALLTDYFLHDAYLGEPGLVVRDFTATRLVDRLVALPEYAERTIPPRTQEQLPPYMRAPDYRQLVGNPAHLHGGGVHVMPLVDGEFTGLGALEAMLQRQRQDNLPPTQAQEYFYQCLDRLLIAGDAHGGIMAHGHSPARDGLWGALLLLQLCAVRQAPVGELWRRLQEKVGQANFERLHLTVPTAVKLPLVNRYLQHYAGLGRERVFGGVKIGGCVVEYVGGVEDRFIEWALTSPRGEPAYLTVQVSATDPVIHAIAEGGERDTPHRLLLAVAERLESLIIEQLRHAEDAWRVVETLASIPLPPAALIDLPGTLNCRIAQQAYARLQELAHPGREVLELLEFVTNRLAELQPEKGHVLAACRPADQPESKRTPPPPRMLWEGEEER